MGGASFWMSAKYNALQTHADAAYLAAQAAMTEAQSHAGMLNPAQAAALRASGFKTTEEGKMVKPAALAAIGGQNAQTAEQLSTTDWRRSNPNYGWFGVGTGMYGPGDTAPAPPAPPAMPHQNQKPLHLRMGLHLRLRLAVWVRALLPVPAW